MITLEEYLCKRSKGNSHAKALSKKEALILELPYPLKRNWAKKFRFRQITPVQYNQLIEVQKELRVIKKNKKTVQQKRTLVETTDFLHTYEWRRLRMEALKKYGAKCMCCGATPASGAIMNVDHIKPRKFWPSLALDINNLQILCHDCNHGKGNWDITDWRSKEIING